MKKFLKSKLILVSIFLLLSSISIGFVVSKLYLTYTQLQNEKQMSLLAVNMTNHIKAQINTMTTVPNILASLLENNNYKTDKFEEWAKELLEKFPNLANIQLARDGIVSHIYPLKDHQGAMGHDLLKDKRRAKGASIAIQSHKLTFVGPLRLIQNNKLAVIARLPIFQSEGKNQVFWGFSTVIVYLEPLLKTGLEQIEKTGFDYKLEGSNPDSSSPALFVSNIEKISDFATHFWIEVPNGKWQITLQPHTPLPSYLLEFELFFIFMGLLFSYLYMHYEKKVNLLLSYETQMEEQDKYESYLKMHNAKLEKISNDLDLERQKYKNLLKYASDEVFIIDTEGNMVEYSNKTKEKLGYSDEEMKNLRVYDWDPEITKEKFQTIVKKLKEESIEIQTKHKTKENTFYDALVSADKIIQDETMLIYCTVRDITKEKELEQKLVEEKNFANSLLESTSMVVLLNHSESFYANKAFLEFFSCSSLEDFQDMYGCLGKEFVVSEHYFSCDTASCEEEWLEKLMQLDEEKRVVSMVSKKDYEPKVFNVQASKVGKNILLSFSDISHKMHRQLELEHQVIHDTLTNAYNREYFAISIEKIIASHKSQDKKTAFAFIDIDFFKTINDTFGHDVGDHFLKSFVHTIKRHSRSEDILIRWGGEEFVLILKVNSQSDMQKALENIREKISQENFSIVGMRTCSIGGTLYEDNEDVEVSLKRADTALYTSKNSGRNRVSIL